MKTHATEVEIELYRKENIRNLHYRLHEVLLYYTDNKSSQK